MMREWGNGNAIGFIYLVDQERLGDNSWQPKESSLALCVEHSGDCFYDYVALVKTGQRLKVGRRFGAYALPKKSKLSVSKTQFHLLLAGRAVKIQ
jgi:hypothetical protein